MQGLIATLRDAPADRPLFLHRGAWINAGDVRAHAAALGDAMAAASGDAIYLHATRISHFLAGLLAAAEADKRIVLPAHTQAAYLAEIGATQDALFDDARLGPPASSRQAPSLPAGSRRSDEDPLLVFFTSGSTATPKPVEKNLSRLEIEARALDALWGGEAGHVIATVSHQHIYGLIYRVLWPLLAGRTTDDEAALYWEDLQQRTAGATLISSPAHLTRLPPGEDFFSGRPAHVFSSGQLLPTPAAFESAKMFGAPPIEVLGSTETGGIAWRQQRDAQTPWTPFPSITLAESDGALIVSSPYLQTDAPLETGDALERLPDGRFHLKPRGDRVAKIDGKRVSLTRVEQVLTALPEISEAAALAVPQRGETLGAIVALTAEGQALLAAHGKFRLSRHLRRAASEQLEPAERPKYWRFVERIPTDSQGKRVLSNLVALFDPPDPLAPLRIDMRVRTESEAELAFALPPELVFFEGHFPDRPILPGVAQAHMAALFAQKLWGVWPSDSNLARVKFRRTLMPLEEVVLKLSHKNGRVTFAYFFQGDEVSRGEIGGS